MTNLTIHIIFVFFDMSKRDIGSMAFCKNAASRRSTVFLPVDVAGHERLHPTARRAARDNRTPRLKVVRRPGLTTVVPDSRTCPGRSFVLSRLVKLEIFFFFFNSE